jgi:hypothetical protein
MRLLFVATRNISDREKKNIFIVSGFMPNGFASSNSIGVVAASAAGWPENGRECCLRAGRRMLRMKFRGQIDSVFLHSYTARRIKRKSCFSLKNQSNLWRCQHA